MHPPHGAASQFLEPSSRRSLQLARPKPKTPLSGLRGPRSSATMAYNFHTRAVCRRIGVLTRYVQFDTQRLARTWL
jgi:hypothetical protein